MKFTIIVSEKDIAGMNIRERLLEQFDFVKTNILFHDYPVFKLEVNENKINLYTIKQDTVFFENPENEIETDYFVFATRHQSKSGEKTLSVHVPGNFSKAEFGGSDTELCTTTASLMKDALITLIKLGKDTEYKITLEATHHGPLTRKPVFFIEIGSSEEQWKDKNAGTIIAKTIIKTIENYKQKDYDIALGFGGSHYCTGFNKIELNSNIAMSHICPKYAISYIDEKMIQKMVNATHEKVDYALIDWKGLNSESRNKIIQILEEMRLKWMKNKDVLLNL